MSNETSQTDTQAVESMDTVQAGSQQEGTLEGQEAMDWQKEAKKFQSMYDKAEAEKKHMDQYKPLVNLLEQRPDLVETLRDSIVGNNGEDKKTETAQLQDDEFNPWDAYNKPGSPSYEMRVKQEEARINNAVNNAMRGQEQKQFISNTMNKLESDFGMNKDEVQEFMRFAQQPKDNVPLDNLVKLFKMNKGEYKEPVIQKPDTSNQARTAGVLQGGSVPTKSEQDGMWDQILNAANAGSISRGIKRK
jgi:hypothetical protein|tara:strand:+ start:209 stop:949 length:741 start_codon:yes stop_codon:yes gene_type:complete